MNASSFAFHFDNAPSTLPSPLSPRSLNIPSPSTSFHLGHVSGSKPFMAPPSPPITPPSYSKHHLFNTQSYSSSRQSSLLMPRHRPSANPLLKSGEQGRRERREGFLSRVQQQREEGRWNLRGDQILQLDYITQQRAWEAQLAQTAPTFDLDLDEEMESANAALGSIPPSSGVERESQSMYPWFQPQSQMSQHMDVATSQQSSFSQPPLQNQTQQPGNRDASQMYHQLSTIPANDEAEIDAMLEAEERELEALIALHEAERAATLSHEADGGPNDREEEMWDGGLPEIRRGESDREAGTGEADLASSPRWGSDDAEFEAELLKLGDDTMDVSGG